MVRGGETIIRNRSMITENEFLEALATLFAQGEIIMKCPNCQLPLNLEEFQASYCESCHDINRDDVAIISTKYIQMN